MTTVSIGRMAVEVAGEGFPVVMIHGLGGSSNTFQPQMEALRGFRVIRVDCPGAGRSPVPHEDLSIESLADATLRAIAALGVERAHFVGHSMGTLICQQIAADRPGLVASLTLFGALIEPSEGMRSALPARAGLARRAGMSPIADQIIEGALSSETRNSRPAAVAFVRESVMRQDPEGYARHCEALASARAADHRLVSAPALLIAGEADGTAPAGVARDLAERLGGARVAVIDGSGHWLTVEKPRECNEKMREFLGNLQ